MDNNNDEWTDGYALDDDRDAKPKMLVRVFAFTRFVGTRKRARPTPSANTFAVAFSDVAAPILPAKLLDQKSETIFFCYGTKRETLPIWNDQHISARASSVGERQLVDDAIFWVTLSLFFVCTLRLCTTRCHHDLS